VLLKSFVVAAALTLAGAIPAAAQWCDDLVQGPTGVVAEVTDGDTVVLDSGLVVRLIGTQAPKLPLGREGFVKWPKADEAKAALDALALGQTVQLGYGGERMDRYGRALAHMFVGEDRLWVQREMVATGWARVYSFPDNRACLPQLLEAEASARTRRLGIWTDPHYTIRAADRPDALLERAGSYELVEGRVLLADAAGGRVYLNFGRYWKEDFTAVLERPALRMFAEAGLDPVTLEGALVRIRGWVDERDGPRIAVTHPEQIEVLATR